jgi:glycosyltransferase involved in cell wall biosynthesis
VQNPSVAPPLVLHILPLDLTRGAQTYAREIRLRLDGAAARHRTLTLFRSDGGALRPDHVVDVEPGLLRRAGFDPRAVWGLRRVLRAEAPAVVVAHGSEPLKYAVLAGVERRRLVSYKIGAGHVRLTGVRRQVYRALLARAGTVAAVSQAAAAEARAFGVDATRLRVIPNGRDPAVYRPAGTEPDATEPDETGPGGSEPGARTGPPHLVWVGHLDPAKRPLRFVGLVRMLLASGADVGATIAGDGPLLDAVRAAARDVGAVRVVGNVDDVPALLAASDLLVLTSAPNEGMPGVLIEAGMAGLPVVTTDVPGATDIVDDGVTGFVVAVDDLDAMVRATRELVDDAALRARFGAAARRRGVARFSLDACLRAWQELLAELIPG